MRQSEENYLASIQIKIESFGVIQREFIFERNGVVALVKLINSLGGNSPVLSLKDPVMQKGRNAAHKVIVELERQLGELKIIEPPQVWMKFHNMMLYSIKLQIEGYKEMLKVFEDGEIKHIGRGKDIVKKGMSFLEGGIQAI